MVWPWACAWQWHARARGNATRMRVATNRAGILLAIMCPGQLKTWTTSNFKSGSGFSRKIVEHGQEWMDFSMGLSHIWGEIWQRGYSSPLWLVFCENLEVRLNHFPFLTDLLWHLEHNGWNSSSASFTQWLAPNPKGPLRSVWLWKNKDKTVCGLIEISERLLQLNVNNN